MKTYRDRQLGQGYASEPGVGTETEGAAWLQSEVEGCMDSKTFSQNRDPASKDLYHLQQSQRFKNL